MKEGSAAPASNQVVVLNPCVAFASKPAGYV